MLPRGSLSLEARKSRHYATVTLPEVNAEAWLPRSVSDRHRHRDWNRSKNRCITSKNRRHQVGRAPCRTRQPPDGDAQAGDEDTAAGDGAKAAQRERTALEQQQRERQQAAGASPERANVRELSEKDNKPKQKHKCLEKFLQKLPWLTPSNRWLIQKLGVLVCTSFSRFWGTWCLVTQTWEFFR